MSLLCVSFTLPLCAPYRSVRFRWYQSFYSGGTPPPTWALDSVYIGPQCQDMCNGHGACVGGTHCICDPGHSGPDCSLPDTPNSDFLKEDFEGTGTRRCSQKRRESMLPHARVLRCRRLCRVGDGNSRVCRGLSRSRSYHERVAQGTGSTKWLDLLLVKPGVAQTARHWDWYFHPYCMQDVTWY